MDSQKGRLILGGIVLVALAALMLYMYSDVLFAGRDRPTPIVAGTDGVNSDSQADANTPKPVAPGGARLMPRSGK
jgi:hypothetical protein